MAEQDHNEDCVSKITLYEQLVLENEAMAKFCLSSGISVPASIFEILEKHTGIASGAKPTNISEEPFKQLGVAHTRLSRLVEPAKPRTILLLDRVKRKPNIFSFLGAVPFIQRMMLAAMISLAVFIVTSLFSAISHRPSDWILFMSEGIPLLIRELFLLSAAGLGASFTALFKANHYIANGTFDPKYESSYWVRFIMGIIAGMIIATLIPISDSVMTEGANSQEVVSFSKPLLAMLGGFSTDVVYRILSRLIETFSSFVSGDKETNIKTIQREQQAKLTEENSQQRFQMAGDIVKLQQEVTDGLSKEDIKKRLSQMTERLTNMDVLS